MVHYAMALDLDRCNGCKACVAACKSENNTPKGSLWMWNFGTETGKYPDSTIHYMSRPCQHCENAPCVRVCPVEARFTHKEGFVLTDYERCIGCRYCEVACPYGVNSFNWKDPAHNNYFDYPKGEGDNVYGSGSVGRSLPNRNPDHAKKIDGRLVSGGGHFKGVMEKCTFCIHRVKKGLLPACVANCPANVYHFGDLDDPDSDVSRFLAGKKSWRLLEHLGTKPSVYYVGGRPPERGMRVLNDKVGGE